MNDPLDLPSLVQAAGDAIIAADMDGVCSGYVFMPYQT